MRPDACGGSCLNSQPLFYKVPRISGYLKEKVMVKELFVCNVDKKEKLLALIKFLNFRLLRGKSTRVRILVDMNDHQLKLFDSSKEPTSSKEGECR